jgi:hypothetical protein
MVEEEMEECYADILIRIRAYDDKAGGYSIEAELSDGSEFCGDALQLDLVALRHPVRQSP